MAAVLHNMMERKVYQSNIKRPRLFHQFFSEMINGGIVPVVILVTVIPVRKKGIAAQRMIRLLILF